MTRSSSKAAPLDAVKKLPWPAIAGGLIAVGKRWRALSEKERARLLALARESGLRPDRLSPKQRKELRRLLAKLDLRGMSGDLGRLVGRVRKRGRWRAS
jgi:hypothetical protein